MSLFPFPKSKPLLDFSRRRGPPAPLRLDAAYQKKVERNFEKFTEPNPPTACLVIDSECDQVFRLTTPHEQLSGKTIQRQRSSSSSSSDGGVIITWAQQQEHTPLIGNSLYTLDHTQLEGSDTGSDNTLWSSGDALSGSISRRDSNGTLSSADVYSVDNERVPSSKDSVSSKSFPQAWWKQHTRSMSFESTVTESSHISMPAQCRIDQSGSFKDWNGSRRKHQHYRSQSY